MVDGVVVVVVGGAMGGGRGGAGAGAAAVAVTDKRDRRRSSASRSCALSAALRAAKLSSSLSCACTTAQDRARLSSAAAGGAMPPAAAGLGRPCCSIEPEVFSNSVARSSLPRALVPRKRHVREGKREGGARKRRNKSSLSPALVLPFSLSRSPRKPERPRHRLAHNTKTRTPHPLTTSPRTPDLSLAAPEFKHFERERRQTRRTAKSGGGASQQPPKWTGGGRRPPRTKTRPPAEEHAGTTNHP
jgi:hypothetical protein